MERNVFRAFFFHLIFGLTPALFTAGMPGVGLAQQIQGTPWKGQPGVTESVATIMARGKNAPPGRPNSDRSKSREHGPDGRTDNPDAPVICPGPPSAASGGTGNR